MKVSASVFSYFKPTILLMRCFGLAPFTYILEGKCLVLKRSLKWGIFSYAFGFFIGVSACIGSWINVSSENDAFVVFINITDVIGLYSIVLFGILTSLPNLKELFGIIEIMDKIRAQARTTISDIKYYAKYTKIIIFAAYSIIVLILLLDIYASIENDATLDSTFIYIRNYYSYYLSYLVIVSQQLAYCNIMYFLKESIIVLNSEIEKSINGKYIRNTKNMQNTKNCFVDSIVLDHSSIKTGKKSSFHCASDISIERVRNFMKIHEHIFRCVGRINNFFGYNLLLILINCLLQSVIYPWTFISNPSHKTRSVLHVIMDIVWLIVVVSRLIFVIEPSHRCLVEFEKTNPLIVRLLKKTRDYQIRKEVEIFAIQGELYTVHFTSAEVVTLRRPVFASIASAVTTYLVILIQLKQ